MCRSTDRVRNIKTAEDHRDNREEERRQIKPRQIDGTHFGRTNGLKKTTKRNSEMEKARKALKDEISG